MLAKVGAPASVGIHGRLIDVECDVSNGLPAFIVVGLGDEAVKEARDRVRSALKNSGLVMPPKRVTLNLAPADLPKDGTAYDLSIAVAILASTGQVKDVSSALFVGELALDGSLRPVRGALTYARLAKHHGLKYLFLPKANAQEASLGGGVTVLPAANLLEVYRHLVGEKPIMPHIPGPTIKPPAGNYPDFAEIAGQSEAKRALEIAAAGNHNILLTGPPGVGKTMLAKAAAGILPKPDIEEMIEITQLHSLAGLTNGEPVTIRPFRSPHHTSSDIALVGGGRNPRPGEISLSHLGVLFLDELPEFPRHVLEALRQPLEDGTISIARASGAVSYPARFMLIAAQNPCPCGFAGDPVRDCTCTMNQIAKYGQKVSGPLLDRIDMVVHVQRIDPEKLRSESGREPTSIIADRVETARKVQYSRAGRGRTNSSLSGSGVIASANLNEDADQLIHQAAARLQLSTRSHLRIIKVARTIADLENSRQVTGSHIAEALQYRPKV